MATTDHAPASPRPLLCRAGLLVLALAAPATAAPETEPPGLFASDEILEVELEAPILKIVRGRFRDVEGTGTLAVAGGPSLAVSVTTFGKSRLEVCDFPPLKIEVDVEEARGTPFEGLPTLRMVSHCRFRPGLERHMLMEYLAYRSYDLLAEPALGVRLARIDYRDSDGRRRDETRYGFFVEDIGQAASRYGMAWTERRAHRVRELDPLEATVVALFQYMIGNTDWSALSAPEGDRCCHNVALLETADRADGALLPFDFDQSGLVDAPYAVPDRRLGLRSVRQRIYRGLCVHNDAVPRAIEIFQRRRAEIQALFADEALPEPRQRRRGRDYIEDFYEEIEDPRRLQRLLASCRKP